VSTAENQTLTPRQQREVDYHRDYAREKAQQRLTPVNLDILDHSQRRWANAHWHAYTVLMKHDLRGKKVLIPGCGFGEDAVRLSQLGAEVHAFDLSPEILDVAQQRIDKFGYENIYLAEMPCEAMTYDDNFFDVIFFIDILHHVDIAKAAKEIQRTAKKGAVIAGNELYTHSFLQKNIRESFLVDKLLYRPMKRVIYGANEPYITEDEHKIDENEFAQIAEICENLDVTYFNSFVGRLVPDRLPFSQQADRTMTRMLGNFGRFTAGRIIFDGVIAKT